MQTTKDVFAGRVSVGPETAVPHMRGVVFVHACARALSAHVEWTLAGILGPRQRLGWTDQPALAGSVRADLTYRAPVGTAARIASELRAFPGIRYEVTQEPLAGVDGERYAFTPSLGIHRSTMGPHGDIVVQEDHLRNAMAAAESYGDLRAELDRLLGAQWDAELEVFRHAGAVGDVRVVHEVG